MFIRAKPYNQYGKKDVLKASLAQHFIGRGTTHSSTEFYRNQIPDANNPHRWESGNLIFVSVEGARNPRLKFDRELVDLAIAKGMSFVADNTEARERMYNIGERELARYLTEKGYHSLNLTHYAIWEPKP